MDYKLSDCPVLMSPVIRYVVDRIWKSCKGKGLSASPWLSRGRRCVSGPPPASPMGREAVVEEANQILASFVWCWWVTIVFARAVVIVKLSSALSHFLAFSSCE